MKRLSILFIFLVMTAVSGLAQNEAKPAENRVALLARRAIIAREIGSAQQERVDAAVSQLLETNLGSGPKYAAFALEPRLELVDEGKIEGMDSRPTAKLSLAFKAVNLFSGEHFGGFELSLVGSGATRDEAIKKAILSVKKSQAAFDKNAAAMQDKIADFYKNECPNLLRQARDFEKEQKLADAISILHGIPDGASCRDEAQNLKLDLLKKQQAQLCETAVQQADARSAANDFAGSLAILARIDAAAPCFSEAKTRIAALESKVDEAEKTRYEWLFKFAATGADAEKARWQALTAFCLDHLKASGRCCN